jgi:HSP20 family protein
MMANLASRQTRPAPIARRFSEWDPFERMRDLLSFDPLQAFPRRWFGEEGMSFTPRFDAREDNDCYVIQADMPGIKESDVDISVTGNRLMISGQREEEKLDESKSYYTRERSFGSFSRAFTLPDSIDSDHIQASMNDGVLEVKIPQSTESQPKKNPLAKGEAGSASAEPPSQLAPKEEGM